MACARCHDHKFDPITSEDYYALAGIFAGTQMFNRPLDQQREVDADGQAKKPQDALHIVREGQPTDLNVFIRGDVNNKGPLVKRRFIDVLSRGEARPFTGGSGRAELAERIVDPHNPLTTRVFVNRVWAKVFGKALVTTPSNFGALGSAPSHPQLLDDVATRFVESQWSIKWLLRELVLSSSYRQSGDTSSHSEAVDPENRLLWRMNRRRLDVESWRDAILAAAGRLEARIGGRSIDPQNADQRRRTVYSRISRLELNKMLVLFDFPDPNAHSSGRSLTTTPLQKLFVMNSPFMVRQSEALSERLLAIPNLSTEQRIRSAYWQLFGRPANQQEVRLGVEFMAGNRPQQAWVGVCPGVAGIQRIANA